jgi:hypothetical protein
MNTQTNKSEQHAGNGDTANHKQKSNESVARKYYTQVEGKTLEETRDIIKRLVSKGMLKDAVFYNEAIAKDAEEKARVSRRDAERKEQAERDAQARADFEAKQKAEQNGDYKLDPLVEEQIKDFIAKGATKAVIVGMLKFMTKLNKVQIAKVIEDLMPERAKGGRGASLDDRFNQYCVDAMRTNEELTKWITENGSDNFIKFTAHLLKRAEFFNAIHALYTK